MKLVIAPSYHWFIGWATVDMKVNSSDYTYLSGSVRGRRPIPGDEVYVLNWMEIGTQSQTSRERKLGLVCGLLGAGFETYYDEHGFVGHLRDLIR